MTVQELKSVAYDLLVSLENVQNNLKIVNTEIAKRQNSPKAEEVKAPDVEVLPKK